MVINQDEVPRQDIINTVENFLEQRNKESVFNGGTSLYVIDNSTLSIPGTNEHPQEQINAMFQHIYDGDRKHKVSVAVLSISSSVKDRSHPVIALSWSHTSSYEYAKSFLEGDEEITRHTSYVAYLTFKTASDGSKVLVLELEEYVETTQEDIITPLIKISKSNDRIDLNLEELL